MKRSSIILSLAFAASIASCQNRDDQWISGETDGRYRDTVANGHHYRYFGGAWYPIYHNMIAPGRYQGASISHISRPGFTPMQRSSSSGTRSGGFGRSSSSHASYGG